MKFVSAFLLSALLLGKTARAVEAPLVDLDARNVTDSAVAWQNKGTVGGTFAPVGHPEAQTIKGVQAVGFDGKRDAYRGPNAPEALTGGKARTIEVWAYNPEVGDDEETMVSWGKRGGPAGTLMAFGWGRNPAYGAVSHWAADLAWNSVPRAGRWHYLVYAYDGTTARIYDDGLPRGERGDLRLETLPGLPILLAAESGADGSPQFLNEQTHGPLAGALSIATVRIHARALGADEIAKTFAAEAGRFGATAADAEGVLAKGVATYDAGPLKLTLLRATQTAVTLSPDGQFDFLPGDRLQARADDGNYFLGDVTLRVRFVDETKWQGFTSAARVGDIAPIDDPQALAACDLTPNLGPGCPVSVERRWLLEDGHLVLRFTLANKTARPVEVGAFGAAMVFNNYLTGRSLDDAHEHCSLATPAICGDAGYMQVTRLNGAGPTLLVLPERGTSFEAYRPLFDDPTRQDVTFEGFYEWMTHTAAYADNEWKDAAGHWNPPTSETLAPGESRSVAYRFALSPTISRIEETLAAEKRPVAVGVPGYALATDEAAKLFLRYGPAVRSLAVEPAGALQCELRPEPTAHGWRQVALQGVAPGRSRLTITYEDGTRQTISYFVTPPATGQVSRLGQFHATRQWFTDAADPFKRTNSWLPFDRRTDSIVTQHEHTWFVGLSDEIGAGASVAMAMKNLGQPDPAQVAQLELYADTALFGNVQNRDYGIRGSVFYFDHKALPNFKYTVGGGWDKPRTETTWRSYNYPHVTTVYWSLYHLARDHQGLVKQHPWNYYLEQAYQTAMAMRKFAAEYDQFGLMVGSVFPELVRDLRREGWREKADTLEGYARKRERHWESLRYPFGSEMPWDTTGQEEVYAWTRYFGADDKAQVTVNAVTAYMPAVPNWAYNGAARRYFDAMVNGNAWQEIVQNTNHYGSSLNAIPVLDAYRRDPANLYLLRIGYAGMDQVLCNIDARGFASYGFNTNPAHLDFDPYTADYGIAFYGYARNAGTYVTHDPEFGWLAFGGVVTPDGDGVTVEPRDGFRQRVFLAPARVWLTLEAGTIERVRWNETTRQITLTLSPAAPDTATALLRVEQPGSAKTGYAPVPALPVVRDAFAVPLKDRAVSVTLEDPARGGHQIE